MTITAEERELHELDEKIADTASRERTAREQADQVIARIRGEGKNPLTDKAAFTEVDEAYKGADQLRDELAEMRDRRSRASSRATTTGTDPTPERPQSPRLAGLHARMGQRFAASDAVTKLVKSGLIGQGARFDSDAVEVATREEARMLLQPYGAAHYSAATLDGDPLVPEDQRLFPPVAFPVRAPALLDLITIGSTDSDIVKYVEETTRTDAAAETAKGELLPEATYIYTPRETSVKPIGHFLAGHEDNLADQGQLQTLIEGRLGKGVELRAEKQVAAGDGAGENLRGIYNTVGIGSQPKGGDTVADAMHKGITLVRVALEAEPTAIGYHPVDWEKYATEKGGDGHYLHGGGTLAMVTKTSWGLPAVVSTVFTQGSPLVGYYPAAILYLRDGIKVVATNGYLDFFRRRMVAFRATMRAALAVAQPKAFAKVTGL